MTLPSPSCIVSKIAGTGLAVPNRVVTNNDLTQWMDTSDEWIRTRTGIEQRYWAQAGERGVDLGLKAAHRALEGAKMPASEVDAIVYATCTPDQYAPGNGVFLQRQLGCGWVPAIDIRVQCSGFIYGLSIADAWIRTGLYKSVLVVGQELQSTALDLSTRGRDVSVLFADGAGAAILKGQPSGDGGVLAFDLHSDGNFAEKLWCEMPGALPQNRPTSENLATGRQYIQMEGREVFRHAVTRMCESAQAVLTKAQKRIGDLKLVIPHQANLRIAEAIQKNLDLPSDKIYNNIMRYGNTTAATIPIALDECVRAGRLQRGDLVLLTAFGSGFLWGSCLIEW